MRAQLAVKSDHRIAIETVRIDDTGAEEIVTIYPTDLDAEAPIEEIYQGATKRLVDLGYQVGPWRNHHWGAGHVADIEALSLPKADDTAARRQAILDFLKEFGLIPDPDGPEVPLAKLELAADLARAAGPDGQVYNASFIAYEPNLED